MRISSFVVFYLVVLIAQCDFVVVSVMNESLTSFRINYHTKIQFNFWFSLVFALFLSKDTIILNRTTMNNEPIIITISDQQFLCRRVFFYFFLSLTLPDSWTRKKKNRKKVKMKNDNLYIGCCYRHFFPILWHAFQCIRSQTMIPCMYGDQCAMMMTMTTTSLNDEQCIVIPPIHTRTHTEN